MTDHKRLLNLEEFVKRLEKRIEQLEEEASFAYIQDKIEKEGPA